MASTYPSSLDSFATNKADGTATATDHKNHHNDLADAVNKIEAELGTNPSGLATSVKAKLDGMWVNTVTEYGAIADASTDNTTVINQAITDVNAAGGGIVYTPGSTSNYKIAKIILKPKVWFMGAGEATEFRSINNNPNSGLFVLSDAADDYWILSHFLVNGLKNNQIGPLHGLYFNKTGDAGDSRFHIFNIAINSCKGDGAHFEGRVGGGFMKDCYFGSNDGHGLYLAGNVTDNVFDGVVAGNSGLDGWHLASGAGTNHLVGCESFWSGLIASGTAGDGFSISTGTNLQLANCKAQDNARNAYYLDNSTDVYISNSIAGRNFGAAIKLNGAMDCKVDLKANFAAGGTTYVHNRMVELTGTNTRNDINVAFSDDALTAATAPVNGTVTGNRVIVTKGARSTSAPTFAASFTPDPYLYEVVTMTVTANITINAPTYQHRGQKLRFIFTEDGTGGWTFTWNSVFKTSWGPSTAAGAINTIEFECDGTNWYQIGATTPSIRTYSVSNVSTDRTFNANSYSMDELADVVGTLITDLQEKKIIG